MLRTFYKSDIPAMLAIEQSSHVVPWNEDTFKTCVQEGYAGWVIEVENKPVGFIIISLRADECHILNVCVLREYQHQGYGRKLLEHALSHAKQQHVGIAYLEVRVSNSRAISLYKKMNFHLIGERKGYYPMETGNEDALIFAKGLQDKTI